MGIMQLFQAGLKLEASTGEFSFGSLENNWQPSAGSSRQNDQGIIPLLRSLEETKVCSRLPKSTFLDLYELGIALYALG